METDVLHQNHGCGNDVSREEGAMFAWYGWIYRRRERGLVWWVRAAYQVAFVFCMCFQREL